MFSYLGSCIHHHGDFSGGTNGKTNKQTNKNPPANADRHKRREFNPWVRKIPLKEGTATHSVFVPGQYSPMDREV